MLLLSDVCMLLSNKLENDGLLYFVLLGKGYSVELLFFYLEINITYSTLSLSDVSTRSAIH